MESLTASQILKERSVLFNENLFADLSPSSQARCLHASCVAAGRKQMLERNQFLGSIKGLHALFYDPMIPHKDQSSAEEYVWDTYKTSLFGKLSSVMPEPFGKRAVEKQIKHIHTKVTQTFQINAAKKKGVFKDEQKEKGVALTCSFHVASSKICTESRGFIKVGCSQDGCGEDVHVSCLEAFCKIKLKVLLLFLCVLL